MEAHPTAAEELATHNRPSEVVEDLDCSGPGAAQEALRKVHLVEGKESPLAGRTRPEEVVVGSIAVVAEVRVAVGSILDSSVAAVVRRAAVEAEDVHPAEGDKASLLYVSALMLPQRAKLRRRGSLGTYAEAEDIPGLVADLPAVDSRTWYCSASAVLKERMTQPYARQVLKLYCPMR